MLIDLPETVDFTVKQGDTLRVEIELRDNDQNPVNLTGHSVELNVSAARGRAPRWTWKDSYNFAHILSYVNGRIQMGLTATATRDFGRLERLAYDLVLESPTGFRTTIMAGTFRVRLESKGPT